MAPKVSTWADRVIDLESSAPGRVAIRAPLVVSAVSIFSS